MRGADCSMLVCAMGEVTPVPHVSSQEPALVIGQSRHQTENIMVNTLYFCVNPEWTKHRCKRTLFLSDSGVDKVYRSPAFPAQLAYMPGKTSRSFSCVPCVRTALRVGGHCLVSLMSAPPRALEVILLCPLCPSRPTALRVGGNCLVSLVSAPAHRPARWRSLSCVPCVRPAPPPCALEVIVLCPLFPPHRSAR